MDLLLLSLSSTPSQNQKHYEYNYQDAEEATRPDNHQPPSLLYPPATIHPDCENESANASDAILFIGLEHFCASLFRTRRPNRRLNLFDFLRRRKDRFHSKRLNQSSRVQPVV